MVRPSSVPALFSTGEGLVVSYSWEYHARKPASSATSEASTRSSMNRDQPAAPNVMPALRAALHELDRVRRWPDRDRFVAVDSVLISLAGVLAADLNDLERQLARRILTALRQLVAPGEYEPPWSEDDLRPSADNQTPAE